MTKQTPYGYDEAPDENIKGGPEKKNPHESPQKNKTRTMNSPQKKTLQNR